MPSGLIGDSICAMISVIGNVGVTAKFNSFFNRVVCASLIVLKHKLLSHFVLSMLCSVVDFLTVSFSRGSFSNFCCSHP